MYGLFENDVPSAIVAVGINCQEIPSTKICTPEVWGRSPETVA